MVPNKNTKLIVYRVYPLCDTKYLHDTSQINHFIVNYIYLLVMQIYRYV